MLAARKVQAIASGLKDKAKSILIAVGRLKQQRAAVMPALATNPELPAGRDHGRAGPGARR